MKSVSGRTHDGHGDDDERYKSTARCLTRECIGPGSTNCGIHRLVRLGGPKRHVDCHTRSHRGGCWYWSPGGYWRRRRGRCWCAATDTEASPLDRAVRVPHDSRPGSNGNALRRLRARIRDAIHSEAIKERFCRELVDSKGGCRCDLERAPAKRSLKRTSVKVVDSGAKRGGESARSGGVVVITPTQTGLAGSAA